MLFLQVQELGKDMLSRINEFLLHYFLILITTSFITLFFLINKRLCMNPSKKSLPPSPPKLPILGNLHQLSPLTHRSFQSFGTKYGPITLIYLGNMPVIVVQSPHAASEILKTHDLIFSDKPHTRTTRRLLYDQKDMIIAPYGEYWRKLKSICVLQLLSSRRVQSFSFIREEETALLIQKIGSSSSPVNLSELFDLVANDVICRSAFGRKYSEGEYGKKILMLIRETVQLMGTVTVGEFIPWLSWINGVNGFDRRVKKVAEEVDEFLEQIIEEHFNGGLESGETVKDMNRRNFVGILLDVYEENYAGLSIDRDGIKAIILDMLVGGTDTTSAALEWAMTELLRHPTALKKLQTEVREILKNRQDINDKDLQKMQYLKAVIKETLRLHPPVPFVARVAREDVKIMGYDIKAGTMMITNNWAIGRDPASWDEPHKFQPSRFLNSSMEFKGLDFELIPFGTGRRGCPGTGFAMASVELVLANLVQKFEWGLPYGAKWEDLDITEQPGVTIHRKHSLFAVATHCYS